MTGAAGALTVRMTGGRRGSGVRMTGIFGIIKARQTRRQTRGIRHE